MSSRPFNARNTSGMCYFCDHEGRSDSRIKRGDRVLYLTARAVNDAPGRPLNTRELREWRKLGRARKAARRLRRPVPKAPEWLWDRMVHVLCAQTHNFPIPGGEASPINGTRWRGWGDGAQVAGTVATRDPARESDATRQRRDARIAREESARAERERAARIAREARQARVAAERAEREAREAAEREVVRKAAEFEQLRVDDPSAARFRLLNLDDNAPRQDDSDEPDPSVERFRRLDLD